MDPAWKDALDLNYRLASARTFACSDVGEALETRDILIATCGFPVAEFNWAFLKTSGGNVTRGRERAERYFDERELPFQLILRRDLVDAEIRRSLAEGGHRVLENQTPGMALDPLRKGPAPPGELAIRRVADDRQLADFQSAAFAGFGIPVAFGATFLTADLLESPESALFVGYVEGVPVATSMLLATGPVAGIYWVATIESHRKRGYAEALTWAALEAGLELGCRVGSLQASEMGRPVYTRMGFEHWTDYTNFQRPAAG